MGTPIEEQSDDVTSPVVSTADGLLLDQFVKDGNPDAFAALMHRHGPYILALCKRLTWHAQDAEDVFQACFLELVRRAPSIRQQQSLIGWLHTVAVRMARKAYARRSERRQREQAVVNVKEEASTGADGLGWREACRILDEEIAQLPDDLRLPILLCLFEGRTQDEVAQELGINPRTIKDRLRRGRESLRDRLVRRGVTLAVLGALLSAANVHAGVPAVLQHTTLAAATAVANNAPLAGVVSPGVAALTGSTGFAGWAVLAAAVVGLLLTASAAFVAWENWPAPPQVVAEPEGPMFVRRSFRGKQFDTDFFQWAGGAPPRFAWLEDEGLRVTLPAKNVSGDSVGIKLRYPVHGDFELETTLEILGLPQPDPAASGAGASIYVLMDSPRFDGVWLGKVTDPARGPVFNVGHRIGVGKDRVNNVIKTAAADNERGLTRLRMVRQGAVLSVSTSNGGDEFQPLHEMEVSDANLSIVRIAADPVGLADVAIDMRIVDFSIRAEELIGYAPQTK